MTDETDPRRFRAIGAWMGATPIERAQLVAYQSLTLHMLISAPGDVPKEDIETVRNTISRWNFRSGRRMAPTPVTVVGVSWSEHAYSTFGMRPQEAINEQLVKEADLAFAMFADRLGTPTGEADSGTVEEIEVMRQAGKHVSIVRNVMPRSTTVVEAMVEQARLETYLQQVERERRGLLRKYDNLVDLAEQVNIVLTNLADRFVQDLIDSTSEAAPGDDPSKGVWPTVEVVERQKSDSKGRLSTDRNWYMVLANRTGGPVRNVRFRYETSDGDEETLFDGLEHDVIDVLAPDARDRLVIAPSMASPNNVICIVTWEDFEGGEHETRATVRLV